MKAAATAEATVQVRLSHEPNRRLIAEHLGERHRVVEGAIDDGALDLCVLDGGALRRDLDALLARKRESEPVFLPYLLVSNGERVARASLTTAGSDDLAVWDVVDEVIDTPVRPAELDRRVESLLDQRRLSRVLDERKTRSESRFRALLEAAPDPIVATDAEGRVTDLNAAFSDAFGVDEGALLGVDLAAFDGPGEDLARVLREADAGDGPAGALLEWEFDGGERLVAAAKAGVVTDGGRVTDRIAVLRDVTTLKEREATLEAQNERLQTFAGTIAHDLRNPLTIAKGNLELARESGDPERFTAIDRALGRIEELSEQVLTLAEHGRTVLDPEPVAIPAVAETAWSHVATADATLSVEADGVVLADESRLCELFENLFNNAVQHGRPDVAVRVGDLPDGGFYVADDGPGVPEPDRESVFELGFTTAEDGTGYGLSIVRQIAKGHGWTVSVAESDGGGARFEVAGVRTPASA